VDFLDRQRARSDKAHLAAQDVPELGKFIKSVPPQMAPQWGHPRSS